MSRKQSARVAMVAAVLGAGCLGSLLSAAPAGAQTNCPTSTTTGSGGTPTTPTTTTPNPSPSPSPSPSTTEPEPSPSPSPQSASGTIDLSDAVLVQSACPGSNTLANTGLDGSMLLAAAGGGTALALSARWLARRAH